MSALDKTAFSGNDIIKGIIMLTTLGSMWYNLKLDIKDLKTEISEIKTHRTADDRVIGMKIDRLEAASAMTERKTNEIEKDVFRLLAIVPNTRLEIQHEEKE